MLNKGVSCVLYTGYKGRSENTGLAEVRDTSRHLIDSIKHDRAMNEI